MPARRPVPVAAGTSGYLPWKGLYRAATRPREGTAAPGGCYECAGHQRLAIGSLRGTCGADAMRCFWRPNSKANPAKKQEVHEPKFGQSAIVCGIVASTSS
jgi:hypothetical protein